jgi:hypothetical protein
MHESFFLFAFPSTFSLSCNFRPLSMNQAMFKDETTHKHEVQNCCHVMTDWKSRCFVESVLNLMNNSDNEMKNSIEKLTSLSAD